MEIINIKNKVVSLALVVSTIITGLGLSNTASAANDSESKAISMTCDDISKDLIFESYIVNYYLHPSEGEIAPQISEYYEFVKFISDAIYNSEKNKEKPYSDEIILKTALLYAKGYFYTLNLTNDGTVNVNIPNNIGEILYDVVPIMGYQYYVSEEDSKKVETYKLAVQAAAAFYQEVYPQIADTPRQR